MTPNCDRSAGPRIATALAFALIVVALSSGHASTGAAADTRPSIERTERARLLAAAAVAATRDLLGVDEEGSISASAGPVAVARNEAAVDRLSACDDIAPPCLRPSHRLIDLPPPIC